MVFLLQDTRAIALFETVCALLGSNGYWRKMDAVHCGLLRNILRGKGIRNGYLLVC